MSNFALKTDGQPLLEIERKLRKYLPGLDVRLWPFSASQAIIRAPLVRALDIDYPHIGAGPLLKVIGVASIRSITDEETIALLAGRDVEFLAPRPTVPQKQVAGFDWHLDTVGAPPAWALMGGPGNIAWGDVKVGHIDTGYTQHPALGFGAATWIDVGNAKTIVPPAASGEATMIPDEPGGGVDNLSGVSAGHGTRMASAISGHAPNAPGGSFYGVAPKVPLLPIRITDIVWINHAQRQFAEAMDYAVDTWGAKVVNVSLGVFAGFVIKEMRDSLDHAYEKGVIVVCAAGNYVNSVVAPARLDRTVAVGGTTRDDAPWSGSSYGPEVDFSAPASGLRRASTTNKGQFEYALGGDGTSYATAMTTGAAALWLSHRAQEIASAYPQPWQRVAAFTALARDNASVPKPWQLGSFGTGVLNIKALLDAKLPAAGDLMKAANA